MNDLAHLLQFLIDPVFGFFKSLLAEVDRVREQRAALLDALSVATLREFDASVFQKTGEILVKFVFGQWFHR